MVLNFDLNEFPVDEDMVFDEYELPGYKNVVFDMIRLPVEDEKDVASNTTSPEIGDSSSSNSELLGPKETYDVLPAVPMDEDVALKHEELKSGNNTETCVAKEDNKSDQVSLAVDGGKVLSNVKLSAQLLEGNKEKVLRSNKVVKLVKMWNHSKGRITWEGEEDMKKHYPLLFQNKKM
nr:hypothetical protein CFP56_32707 [Quercus suber]